MAFYKVTLLEDFVRSENYTLKAGTTLRVTKDLYDELAKGGYISVPEVKEPAPKKAPARKTKKQTK